MSPKSPQTYPKQIPTTSRTTPRRKGNKAKFVSGRWVNFKNQITNRKRTANWLIKHVSSLNLYRCMFSTSRDSDNVIWYLRPQHRILWDYAKHQGSFSQVWNPPSRSKCEDVYVFESVLPVRSLDSILYRDDNGRHLACWRDSYGNDMFSCVLCMCTVRFLIHGRHARMLARVFGVRSEDRGSVGGGGGKAGGREI